MKTKDKEKNMPTKPKLPKARVMWADFNFCDMAGRDAAKLFEKPDRITGRIPVLVIPFPSRKAAESARKFWSLTESERVERLAEAIFAHKNPHESWASWKRGTVAEGCREYARACLAAMGGRK